MNPTPQTPKYGQQIVTSKRCKICNAVKRVEIEDAACLRLAGESMENGIRPTIAWFEENSLSYFGIQLTEKNLTGHMRRHFQIAGVNPTQKQKDAVALKRATTGPVSVDDFLHNVVAAGNARVLMDPDKVTTDQAIKAAAELTRRKNDETTAGLLHALTGSVQSAIEKIPDPEPRQVDVEVLAEEVEEVVEAE